MSEGHDTDIPESRQPNLTENSYARELSRAELRVKLGVVSRGDLELILGISPLTLTAWTQRGLAPFRPGTSKDLFSVAEVSQFLAGKPHFSGAKQPDRRRRKKLPQK